MTTNQIMMSIRENRHRLRLKVRREIKFSCHPVFQHLIYFAVRLQTFFPRITLIRLQSLGIPSLKIGQTASKFTHINTRQNICLFVDIPSSFTQRSNRSVRCLTSHIVRTTSRLKCCTIRRTQTSFFDPTLEIDKCGSNHL